MVTDTPPSTIRACIIFSKWLRQTSRIIFSDRKILHTHLLYKGFMPHYNVWTRHEEYILFFLLLHYSFLLLLFFSSFFLLYSPLFLSSSPLFFLLLPLLIFYQ